MEGVGAIGVQYFLGNRFRKYKSVGLYYYFFFDFQLYFVCVPCERVGYTHMCPMIRQTNRKRFKSSLTYFQNNISTNSLFLICSSLLSIFILSTIFFYELSVCVCAFGSVCKFTLLLLLLLLSFAFDYF